MMPLTKTSCLVLTINLTRPHPTLATSGSDYSAFGAVLSMRSGPQHQRLPHSQSQAYCPSPRKSVQISPGKSR
ncbi:hypothetical protein EV421DRAFT_1876113 [Armillaria borealis]|uniref:Uncharacterized protein n=1 Tax=Armillaria borealis TaxID=47425 RepID=A0AA39IBZ3_9AGAR|nr:hypothetical protein EV421DRAFT_1876113 [Armillaria borealis]